MDPEMDTSKMRVPLQGVVKTFEAGLPKPGTSMGCPNLLPQHIVRDVICVKLCLACPRSIEGVDGRNTIKGG